MTINLCSTPLSTGSHANSTMRVDAASIIKQIDENNAAWRQSFATLTSGAKDTKTIATLGQLYDYAQTKNHQALKNEVCTALGSCRQNRSLSADVDLVLLPEHFAPKVTANNIIDAFFQEQEHARNSPQGSFYVPDSNPLWASSMDRLAINANSDNVEVLSHLLKIGEDGELGQKARKCLENMRQLTTDTILRDKIDKALNAEGDWNPLINTDHCSDNLFYTLELSQDSSNERQGVEKPFTKQREDLKKLVLNPCASDLTNKHIQTFYEKQHYLYYCATQETERAALKDFAEPNFDELTDLNKKEIATKFAATLSDPNYHFSPDDIPLVARIIGHPISMLRHGKWNHFSADGFSSSSACPGATAIEFYDDDKEGEKHFRRIKFPTGMEPTRSNAYA